MNRSFSFLMVLILLLIACSSGKNAFRNGEYDTAVLKAIHRLKQSPKQGDAQDILPQAFDLAVQSHLRKIEEAKISSDPLKWETILDNYKQLNFLVDELNACPACLTLVSKPIKYQAAYEDAKYQAAEARYVLGERLLREGGRAQAKQAYTHFIKAQTLYPTLQGVQQKIADSYWQAVLKVVVQPAQINSSKYQLSNAYFQEQVLKYLGNYNGNRFVQFFTPQDAKDKGILPDHLVQMSFDDFVVGQVYLKEKVEKLKRDSVVIGENRQGKIYGTVRAEYSFFEKQVSSTGLLNFEVIQLINNKPLAKRKFAGTYVWVDNWATFVGDSRALDKNQLALSKKKEVMPPPPSVLFVEFTKPIYDQLVAQINSFYRSY